jgi:alpha-glucosidase
LTADKNWWRGSIFYQVYPRSFFDTNNDGTGDLPGITQKLEYIAGLGVDAIWISPFFQSPQKDFGYDVSDYRAVDPLFGSLKDFDALLEKAHKLKLKVIIDMVLSHTSDQHPWFHDPKKKDWYVWADGKNDGPPNNWVSVFGGSAWTLDETRGQYYLHNFLKEQPDLNFHNPHVQDAVLAECKFWLERGVDGFRLDVVNFYFHDKQLRDNPPREKGVKYATQFEKPDPYSEQQHIYDKSQPENLKFLARLHALMEEYPGTMTLGEIGDDHPYRLTAEYTKGHAPINTCYNTHMMGGQHKKLTASLIREPLEQFIKSGDVWPSWAFSNHDVVRAVSRWLPKGEGFGHDPKFAKMLIALLGSLRGTVFLYQGEELGLPEAKIPFEQIQDPWGKALYPEWQGRDGCRTPMPWDNTANAGFSKAAPWLPLPHSHLALNVKAQEMNRDSVLHFTRQFLKWRKSQSALLAGDITFIKSGNENILKFSRSAKKQTLLCTFNFSDYTFSYA